LPHLPCPPYPPYPPCPCLKVYLSADLHQPALKDLRGCPPGGAVGVVLREDGAAVEHVVQVERGSDVHPLHTDVLAESRVDLREPIVVERAGLNQRGDRRTAGHRA